MTGRDVHAKRTARPALAGDSPACDCRLMTQFAKAKPNAGTMRAAAQRAGRA